MVFYRFLHFNMIRLRKAVGGCFNSLSLMFTVSISFRSLFFVFFFCCCCAILFLYIVTNVWCLHCCSWNLSFVAVRFGFVHSLKKIKKKTRNWNSMRVKTVWDGIRIAETDYVTSKNGKLKEQQRWKERRKKY